MRRGRLIIMAKAPVAGRVKTRLARGIGAPAAANWMRQRLGRLAREVAQDRRWDTLLAVSPDYSINAPIWPRLPVIKQGGGDLGARMRRLLLHPGTGPVVVIGGDIPGVKACHIARAFRALGDHELVFGPATDGGFWLVGARRGAQPLPLRLFQGVRWSCSDTLAQTIATAGDARIGLVDRLQDVDTPTDLLRL